MVVSFANVQQILEKPTEVFGRLMGLGDIVTSTRVDVSGLRVERQSQVAFNTGNWRTHLVAGRADKFGALAFIIAFGGDVAENYNGTVVTFATNWLD